MDIPRLLRTLVFGVIVLIHGCTGAAPPDETPAPTVRWLEVVAADYLLPLEPSFDEGTTQYDALSDEPGITVWVEILTRQHAESVLVNGAPAARLDEYRWRSPASPALVSPTTITVEVPREGLPTLQYDIEVVTP